MAAANVVAARAATTACGPFTPCTYQHDGTFTVPSDVQWIHVHLVGGAGAPANHDNGAPGGLSIPVDAWLDVSQAKYTNLTVHVGGNAQGTHGGANGGGDGGCGDYGPDTCSGGGGGESDIRYGTQDNLTPGTLSPPILAVSPGGGGGGGDGANRNDGSSVAGGAGGTWSGDPDGGDGTGGGGGFAGANSPDAVNYNEYDGTGGAGGDNCGKTAAPGYDGGFGYAGTAGSGGRGGAAGGGGGAGYDGPNELIPDGAVLTRGGVGPGNFIPGGGGGGGGGSCINDYTENDVRFTSTGSGGGGGAGAPYTPPDAQDVVYGAPTTDPPEVVITWVPAAPGGVTGRPYTYRYPGGGHFTDWSGTLPPGLTLAPDGLLTGTPTKSGSYSFTVNRRSDAGEDTRWPVSIAIDLVPHSATGGTIGSFITGLGDLLGRLTEPPIEQGHGISVTFSAETTGVLSDRLALQGAGLARAARARRPLVIAAGRTRVSKLGRTSLKVPLTPRGHRLLRAAIQHHRVLRLTSLVTFRPVGAATITRTGRYRLRP